MSLVHVLRRDAQLGTTDAAALDQLVHDVPRHVGRDREADADAAARGAQDLRVDADELSAQIDERAARVTAVDRRVGLQEVFERIAATRLTALPADDAHRHRLANTERIAHGQDDVADASLVRIAESGARAGRSRRL